MYPSRALGDGKGVIDASKENIFSATINGRAPVVAYQCAIFKNNATSDLMYDTGVVELEAPFYGANAKGDVVPFEYTVPSNDSAATAHTDMENGYIYGYKYILTLWWDLDTNDYSKNCISSYETVFFAKGTPSIAIDSFSTSTNDAGLPVIDSSSCNFSATYSQPNNAGILWFRWTLANADHTQIIERTKDIYANAAVAYACTGLATGTEYAVRVEAQNQDGVFVDSGWVNFAVDYVEVELNSAVVVAVTDKCGISIDIGGIRYIEGEPDNDNYRYLTPLPVDGRTCVEIDAGNAITFSSSEHFTFDIPTSGEHVWSGYIKGDNSSIYYASGTSDIDGSVFSMTLSHAGTEHGLYPADDLYPADNLYPADDDGGYFKLDWNGEEFVVNCHDYLPELYWFVVTMSAGGLKVYAVPFDASFIANATVISPS